MAETATQSGLVDPTGRPMPEDLSGLPGWVRGLIQLATKYGVQTIIAFGLVYWLATSVTSDLKALGGSMAEHKAETTAIHAAINDEIGYHKLTIQILRQICVSEAKNDTSRNECLKQ